jgi:hypothetical protein
VGSSNQEQKRRVALQRADQSGPSNVGLTNQDLSYTEERQPFGGYETKIADKTNQVLNEKKEND